MTDQLDTGAKDDRSLATGEVLSRAQDFEGEDLKQRPWIKPAIGVFVLAFLLLAGPIWGRMNAGGKIDPEVDRTATAVDIEVIVPFELETYHREALSELGVYSGRLRDLTQNGARLRAVSQDNVDRIANFFWVESIRPMA
jgi:hypothetical protein